MIEHSEMYAYHEAGHALVGHVIGRLMSEVSIVSDRKKGYKGYCSFATFTESANNRLQWQNGSHNEAINWLINDEEGMHGITLLAIV